MKRINYYVTVPNPDDECNHFVLQTRILKKKFFKFKIEVCPKNKKNPAFRTVKKRKIKEIDPQASVHVFQYLFSVL